MNILGIIALFCLPLFGSGAVLIISAAVCAYSAYYGFRIQNTHGVFAVLLGIEIVYGFDVGVLSLAYLIAVFLLAALRRFIALAPWSAQRGWRVADALRATLMAYVLWWTMQVGGVFIGHFIYEYGQWYQRLAMVVHTADAWWALGIIVIILIVIRRAHEPFRRPIIFGT